MTDFDPATMPIIQPGGTPDQMGGDGKVHRQRGIDVTQQEPAIDRTPAADVVQGSVEIFATRQIGPGQHFLADGTLVADHPAEGGTFFADGPTLGTSDRQMPPAPAFLQADYPISRDTDTGSGMRGVVAGVGMPVMQADKPRDGDEPLAKAQVFTKDQINAAKAAKKARK
jgi:hypothetical protein